MNAPAPGSISIETSSPEAPPAIDRHAASNSAPGSRADSTQMPVLPADPTTPAASTVPVEAIQPHPREAIAAAITAADAAPKNDYKRFTGGLHDGWKGLVDRIRDGTPAGIINNGSRINFGVKAVADGFGIASALRPGSRSIPRLIANVPTFLTLIPGAMYKEEPVSHEEEESYKKMNGLQYMATKLKQAFDPKHHIVETVAAATMFNGIFTAISGIRQSSYKGVSLRNFTDKVSSETWQGVMTFIAGAIQDFTKDREKAWQQSTSVFLWRIPLKGQQAYTAYFKGYPEKGVAKGDYMQFVNFSLQQTANIFGMFYAGVKKTDDGKIIHLGKDEDAVDLTKEHIKGYEFDKAGHDSKQTKLGGASSAAAGMAKEAPEKPVSAGNTIAALASQSPSDAAKSARFAKSASHSDRAKSEADQAQRMAETRAVGA